MTNKRQAGRPRKEHGVLWSHRLGVEAEVSEAVRTLLKGDTLGEMEPISGKALVDLIKLLIKSEADVKIIDQVEGEGEVVDDRLLKILNKK